MLNRKFNLPIEEITKLKKVAEQSKDATYTKKLLAVRLYGTGYSTAEIHEIVGCTRSTLMTWVEKYQQGGLEELIDQRQGGNHHLLTPAQKEQIKTLLHQYTPYQLLGDKCHTPTGHYWTIKDLELLLYDKYQMWYECSESYRQLLHFCGFSYQRTEKVFKSKSLLKQMEFEEGLEKNC